ncbi:hypothetical protein ACFQ6Q_04275 [Streptomyces sp. NPDC056437]|uniref:hypothetical protein n=1 Tax=Streptomyces sp. NPDC056437 TaxID=3345816 RepID=UPI00367C2BE2
MKTFVVTVRWETYGNAASQLVYTQRAECAADISAVMSDGIARGGLVQLVGPEGVTAFPPDRFIDMTIREEAVTS